MNPGEEPIADDEILLRRIPVSTGWYNPSTGTLYSQAFDPHRTNDTTGLSLSREKYKSVQDVATGPSKMGYYVARLLARQLRSAGIEIVPRPNMESGYDAAHAELPDLNSANRKEDLTIERMEALSSLKIEVLGPFVPNG